MNNAELERFLDEMERELAREDLETVELLGQLGFGGRVRRRAFIAAVQRISALIRYENEETDEEDAEEGTR